MKSITFDDGTPIRCELCHAMFSKSPTFEGEGGPVCKSCQNIQTSMDRAADAFHQRFPGETFAYAGDETFGDRRYEIVEE